MKSYKITVNGTTYDVSIDEQGGNTSAPVAQSAPVQSSAPAPSSAPAGSGSPVKAGAAGKVFKIEKNVGDSVSKGDTVVIIEAMKMEIPVVAPCDGKVTSITCNVGDACESGQSLATIG